MTEGDKRLVVGLLILLLALSKSIFAASDSDDHDVTIELGEVALIDINSTATITLTTAAPTAGGEPPTGDTDNSKLLYYTSVVAAGESRNITVNWAGSDSAPGLSLKVEATSVPAGCGTAAAQVTIGKTAANLITNIGGCATGTGASGAEITYTLTVDDTSQIEAGPNTVTITFTLTGPA